VLSRKIIGKGRFLELEELVWRDSRGTQRLWENAARTPSTGHTTTGGAALMICWLEPSDRLLLVRQFRPPAGGWVIEFPAGLIDADETPSHAAARELLEETGYSGTILRVWPAAYNTPGLSSEKTFTVTMRINERSKENLLTQPRPQEEEEIEVLLVARADLPGFIDRQQTAGVQFDSKVIAYFSALFSEDRR